MSEGLTPRRELRVRGADTNTHRGATVPLSVPLPAPVCTTTATTPTAR